MRWNRLSGVVAALSLVGVAGCSADGATPSAQGQESSKSCALTVRVPLREGSAKVGPRPAGEGAWASVPASLAWSGAALGARTTATLRVTRADGTKLECTYEGDGHSLARTRCDAPADGPVQVADAYVTLSAPLDGELSACLEAEAATLGEGPASVLAPPATTRVDAKPSAVAPVSHGRELPAFRSVEGSRVGTAEARRITAARASLDALQARPAALATLQAGATVPQVIDLARALKNDVDRIYEYVHDEIAYTPTWGLKKGPVGVILDRAGNAFDQANLMVQLLRASGYTADLVIGDVKLDGDEVEGMFGSRKYDAIGLLVASGGIPLDPITIDGSRNILTLPMSHAWVRVTGRELGTTRYHFDPARKATTAVAPSVSLASVTGYSRADFVGDAGGSAGDLGGSMRGFSASAIQNNLHSYTTNLINGILGSHRFETLDQVFGGRIITRAAGAPELRQTDNPVRNTASAPTFVTGEVPNEHRVKMRLSMAGIDVLLYADDLSGKRLTVRYGSDNKAVLKLDGVTLDTATTAGTPGGSQQLHVDIDEPYAANGGDYVDQVGDLSLTVGPGNTFAIMNSWGVTGRGSVEHHRQRARGLAAGSEDALAESLQAMADMWLAERSMQGALAERITLTASIPHHTVGVAGQTSAPYVDIPLSSASQVSKDPASPGRDPSALFVSGGFGSGFESTIIEQTQPVQGISTMSLFDVATRAGNTFYEATRGNWGTVRPKLRTLGLDDDALATADRYVSAGWRLIVPGNGALGKGTWRGYTFLGVSPDNSQATYIINGAKGGFSSDNVASTVASSSIVQAAQPAIQDGGRSSSALTSGDPVSVQSGDFLHRVDDLSVGADDAQIVFSRSYNSGAYLRAGLLGRGWGHSLDARVRTDSDGFQGLGEDSAADAAAMAVALFVSNDLLSVDRSLKTFVLSSLVQQWGVKNLVDNAATVQTPGFGKSLEFIKAPNGLSSTNVPVFRWLAPPGNASRLDKPSNFRLTTKNQVVSSFNADGTIASTRDPNDVGLTFAYQSGELKSVTHTFGWKLDLTYDAGRVKTVSDGGRTVTYGYDGAGNLATVTDARLKATKYSYVSPGRLKSIFYPAEPTVAFVTNVYDGFGRVKAQTNASGDVTNYYVSGYRSEERDPAGRSKVWYFTPSGQPLRFIDPVGRVTRYAYDGQENRVETVYPEGDGVSLKYDGRYNVVESRRTAKDSSADLVTTTAFHATWNKPTSVKDPLNNVTSYEYDANGNMWRRTDPIVDGAHPVTTYVFNARGQVQQVTDPTGRVEKRTYDEAGKKALLTVQVDPSGLNLTTRYGYDAAGNVDSIQDPNGNTRTMLFSPTRKLRRTTQAVPETGLAAPVSIWTYDDDDRLDEEQQLVGGTTFRRKTTYTPTWKVATVTSLVPTVDASTPRTRYAYDAADRLSTVTDREARVTKYDYFADGKVKTEKRAFGTSAETDYATYSYTPNGKIKTVADANGNLTTYTYDAYDRLQKTLFPSKTASGASDAADYEQLGYDSAGNLRTRRTRAGDTVTFTYDALNRQRTRTGGGGLAVAYDLDRAGRRTKVRFANGSQSIAYAHDAAGRATDITTEIGAVSRVVKRRYDRSGNLTRLDWPDGYFVTYEYDDDNRLRFVKESGSTVLATYTYDQLSRRTRLVRGSVTTAYLYSASGDQTGRLYQIVHNTAGSADDVTLTYGYNKEGQVDSVFSSNAAYVYVPGANVSIASAPNGKNELATVAGVSQTYDENANATNPDGLTLGYDGLNHLASASKGGVTADYDYDPLDRRVKKTVGTAVSQSLYADLAELADYNGSNALIRRYVPGAKLDEVVAIVEGGAKRYPLHDRLGSVIGVANAAGNVTAKFTYDAFGQSASTGCQATAAGCNKMRFAGRTFDPETGLYDLRTRAYSPKLGRFLQPDPLRLKDDMNLYAYAHGDPATLFDPMGTEAQTPSGAQPMPSFFDYAFGTRLVGTTTGMGYGYPTFTRGPDVGYNATVIVGNRGLSVEGIHDIDTRQSSVYRTDYVVNKGIDVGFSPALLNLVYSFDPKGTAQDVTLGRSDYVTAFGFSVFWNRSGWGFGASVGGAGLSFSRGVSYSTLCSSATQCDDPPAGWEDRDP